MNTPGKTVNQHRRTNRHGFTLLELMIALAVFSLVMAGVVPGFIMCLKSWALTSVQLEASERASFALQRMIYGVGSQYGLRSACAASIVVTNSGLNWTVSYTDIVGNASSFSFVNTNQQITYTGPDTTNAPGYSVVGKYISFASVTNTASGLNIYVTAVVSNGVRYVATNAMSTFISYRN